MQSEGASAAFTGIRFRLQSWKMCAPAIVRLGLEEGQFSYSMDLEVPL